MKKAAGMIIKNAKVNDKITDIFTENGKIISLGKTNEKGDLDALGLEALPGLIDVHTHGCTGHDTMDADFAPMCDFYAKNGTTSFLPTTMTADTDSLLKVVNADTAHKGAEILGFHLEGPYISEKRKGAQNGDFIRTPSLEEFSRFSNVKMITLAPEIPGSTEFIRAVSGKTVVSIGHTDCDHLTALEAIESGANCLTHTFNAMPPLLHREPGPIGAAVEKHIYAQIICDGLHVAKAAVLAAYRMFGADRLVLISDSIRPAGLPDGEYESGGLPVIMKNGEARMKDGTLAGSSATLMKCVKKAVEFGIPKQDAIRMATETPAGLLGIKKGRVEAGYDADILLVDGDLDIRAVMIGGKIYCTN